MPKRASPQRGQPAPRRVARSTDPARRLKQIEKSIEYREQHGLGLSGFETFERYDGRDWEAIEYGEGDERALKLTRRWQNAPDFFIEATFKVSTGEPLLHALRVARTDPGTEPDPVVTSELMRSISVVDLHRWAKDRLLHSDVLRDLGLDPLADFAKVNRPGRRGRPDHFYARAAARYIELLDRPSPVRDLAEELGVTVTRARTLLKEARDRGLLTEPPAGRAGGELTDKGRELLDG